MGIGCSKPCYKPVSRNRVCRFTSSMLRYDTGAIVRQCSVPVFPDDALDDLKARVRAREKDFVVETLADIANGTIRLVAGTGGSR